MRITRIVSALFFAAFAGQALGQDAAPPAPEAEPYPIKVEIADEGSLPPERLADALYARAALTYDVRHLRQAARLNPKEPVYAYRLATWTTPSDRTYTATDYIEMASIAPERYTQSVSPEQRKKDQKAIKERRAFLEAAIAADPNYLPALYLYALTKPTHELRLQALQNIAAVDSKNCKPYYIMAMLQYDHLTQGRKVIQEDSSRAYPISQNEWNVVMGYLGKGNSCEAFKATPARLPALEDVKVSSNKQFWPTDSVKRYLQFALNEVGLGGFSGAPSTFGLSVYAQQLARQTAWQVGQCAKHGKRAEAEEMLKTIQTFGDKYTSAEPYKIRTFNCGAAVKAIACAAESQFLEGSGDKARIEQVAQDQLTWQMLSQEQVPPSLWITDKAVKVSPTGYLEYPDMPTEEALVDKKLKDKMMAK